MFTNSSSRRFDQIGPETRIIRKTSRHGTRNAPTFMRRPERVGLGRTVSRVPSNDPRSRPPRRSFLWERRCRRPPARHPLQSADHGSEGRSFPVDPRLKLLALARGGVCRAPSVTGTGGALLPHLFTLACDRSHIGGFFSVALSLTRSPRAGGCYPPPLSSRARTFLAV